MINRRWLLAAWLSVLITLNACAGTPAAAPTLPSVAPSGLSVVVASDEFAAGSPRVPFVLYDGAQPLADATAVTVTALDLSDSTAVPGWSGAATPYEDYDVPYWVVYPQLPHAGYWGLHTQITLADGSQSDGQFAIQVVDKTASPNLGETPPASHNRTLQSEPDLAKISSDADPDPDLYRMTVAEALESGRPTVVTFATPAFCTSRLCAPVLEAVKSVAQQEQGAANFIHIEVYKNFNPLEYADEMGSWHLQSEPWTFVIDSSGVVVDRFGGPLSPGELTRALKALEPQS
jgi:hypothetical protein